MTPNGAQPETNRAERAFDAFLDALGGETVAPSERVATPLAETVHRVQALAVADESMPSAATVQTIREGVMGTQHANGPVSVSGRFDHANGSVPNAVLAPRHLPRLPDSPHVVRRPRWLIANASLAVIVLLTIGIGFIAYRIGPGEPSAGDREELSAGVSVGTPSTTPFNAQTSENVLDCSVEPMGTAGCFLFVPIPVEPAECRVTPRMADEVRSLSHQLDRRNGLDSASLRATVGPMPAETTIDAIGATLREIFWCLAFKEDLRAYALFTDGALIRLAEASPLLPASALRGYGTRTTLHVVEARELPDGRVVTTISFSIGHSGGFIQETWVFIPQDDRYLVDGVILTDATPTQTMPSPDPSECQVEPRTINEVAELFASASSRTYRLLTGGTPSASAIELTNAEGTPMLVEPISTPIADAVPPLTEVPEGPAPDQGTVAAVTATWRQYIACGNAGDYFRLTALLSDAGFQRVFVYNGRPPSDEDLANMLSGGNFPVEESFAYQPLAEMRVLPDGRVGAMIMPDENGTFELDGEQWVIFVNIGGQWLIDEFVVLSDPPPVRDVRRPESVIGVGSTVQPTEDGVNLRSAPGSEAEPLAVLDRSDTLRITGPAEVTSDGEMWWPVVTSDGTRGFVLGDFLQVIG